MSTYVSTIFDCTASDEVLAVLDVFLDDFAQSGLYKQIPADLRPVRVRSSAELEMWSTVYE